MYSFCFHMAGFFRTQTGMRSPRVAVLRPAPLPLPVLPPGMVGTSGHPKSLRILGGGEHRWCSDDQNPWLVIAGFLPSTVWYPHFETHDFASHQGSPFRSPPQNSPGISIYNSHQQCLAWVLTWHYQRCPGILVELVSDQTPPSWWMWEFGVLETCFCFLEIKPGNFRENCVRNNRVFGPLFSDFFGNPWV